MSLNNTMSKLGMAGLTTMSLILLIFAMVADMLPVLADAVTRDCSCGYAVNSTSSPYHQVFTEALETDFLHVYEMEDNPCWSPQVYNVTAEAGRGEYGKEATLQDVVPNPLLDVNAWAGQGIHGGDAGLQLWVRSQLQNGLVPMGEIVSKRSDMLYGSFRVAMKITKVPGTCTGFFWYRNNSEEIDMEFLSSSFNATSKPVYLVMQTPQSVEADYNAAGTSTYEVAQLPASPTEYFHEYRFDWTPDKVSFYFDGGWLYDMIYSYPDAPGSLVLNHWSNGNSHWSEGPPKTNAVLTISYVKAYFNSSDPERQSLYASRCKDTIHVCRIPDQLQAPSASGIDPESQAETIFFDRGKCGERMSTPISASQSNTTTHFATSSSSLPSLLPAGWHIRSHASAASKLTIFSDVCCRFLSCPSAMVILWLLSLTTAAAVGHYLLVMSPARTSKSMGNVFHVGTANEKATV